MPSYRLGFIGAGVMAEAIASGAIGQGVIAPQEVLIYNIHPEKAQRLSEKLHTVTAQSAQEVLDQCEMVVLAVKPQKFSTVEGKLGENRPIMVSIMAGVTLSALEARFANVPIARVMPNTPAQIGQGMSAVCVNALTKQEDLDRVIALFDSVGKTVVAEEEQMDAIGALSGCAPAYMFAIIEALADGGVMVGLKRDLAYQLVAQTMLGAAEMVLQSGKHPGELKDMVTSPGGTTIRAMYALEKGALRGSLMQAVEEAVLQSKKLGELK